MGSNSSRSSLDDALLLHDDVLKTCITSSEVSVILEEQVAKNRVAPAVQITHS